MMAILLLMRGWTPPRMTTCQVLETNPLGSLVARSGPTSMKIIHPIDKKSATGLVADVYRALGEVAPGPVPGPFAVHSVQPGLLYAQWRQFRDVFVTGSFERGIKDVLASAVSELNRCPYCVEAHAAMVRSWSRTNLSEALVARDASLLDDDRLRPYLRWALAVHRPDDPALASPPFGTRAERAEAIGVVVNFSYANRVANVFLSDEAPFPFPDVLGFKTFMLAMLRPMMRKFATTAMDPAPDLEEATDLDDRFSWALPSPTVASAAACLQREMNRLRPTTPAPVRQALRDAMDGWRGETLTPPEVDAFASAVPRDERPLARFALRTALCSWAVSDLLADAHRRVASDGTLVAVAALAAHEASLKVASWLT